MEPIKARPAGRLESRTKVKSLPALVASSVAPTVRGREPRLGGEPRQLSSTKSKKASRLAAEAWELMQWCAVNR